MWRGPAFIDCTIQANKWILEILKIQYSECCIYTRCSYEHESERETLWKVKYCAARARVSVSVVSLSRSRHGWNILPAYGVLIYFSRLHTNARVYTKKGRAVHAVKGVKNEEERYNGYLIARVLLCLGPRAHHHSDESPAAIARYSSMITPVLFLVLS